MGGQPDGSFQAKRLYEALDLKPSTMYHHMPMPDDGNHEAQQWQEASRRNIVWYDTFLQSETKPSCTDHYASRFKNAMQMVRPDLAWYWLVVASYPPRTETKWLKIFSWYHMLFCLSATRTYNPSCVVKGNRPPLEGAEEGNDDGTNHVSLVRPGRT